jgi:hypothetical protein
MRMNLAERPVNAVHGISYVLKLGIALDVQFGSINDHLQRIPYVMIEVGDNGRILFLPAQFALPITELQKEKQAHCREDSQQRVVKESRFRAHPRTG